MRAIIRFSVDNEKNGALRNKLTGVLTGAQFVRFGNTATYENTNISETELGNAVSTFWTTAAGHTAGGRIDHFWMYCDRTEIDNIHGNSN